MLGRNSSSGTPRTGPSLETGNRDRSRTEKLGRISGLITVIITLTKSWPIVWRDLCNADVTAEYKRT